MQRQDQFRECFRGWYGVKVISLSEFKSEVPNAVQKSPPRVLHNGQKLCVSEDGSCLKAEEQTVVAPLQTEHEQTVPFRDLADGISGTCNDLTHSDLTLKDLVAPFELSDLKLKEHCISEDCHDLTRSESTLRQEILNSPGCYVEFTEKSTRYDTERSFYAYDSLSLSQSDDDRADGDETMPEFEGFSIDVPSIIQDGVFYNSDLPSFTKEQDSVLEQLCSSSNLVTPSSRPSTRYKINRLPDVYESLPAGILKHMKLSNPLHFNDVDMTQFRESEDENGSGLFGNFELEYDGSFNGKFHSHSVPSSSARFGWLTSKPPLTPPVEKSIPRKASGRSGTSSETVGSNPELVCFRIDENTSTTEENEDPDGVEMLKKRVGSS